MHIRAVVQARMLSRRLRGKSLMAVGDRASLAHVVERLKAMDFIDDIVIATSVGAADDPLAAYSSILGVKCVRGHETDLLKRFCDATDDMDPDDCVMRVTADNILYDPHRSKKAFEEYTSDDWDYVHIDGLSHVVPEFIRVSALRKAEQSTDNARDREHVTPFLRRHKDEYRTKVLPSDFAGLRPAFDRYLTLDTPEDYERLNKMLEELDGNGLVSLEDVYRWLEQEVSVLYIHPQRPDEMRIRLAGREVGDGCPTFILAEIGQNHNGDMHMARRLIDMAARCGVDGVKFQKRDISWDLSEQAYNKIYDNPNSFGRTYGEHREFLELTEEQHYELREYAMSLELLYICTACDPPSVDAMERIGNPVYKVASRDITNIPLLKKIAETGKPVILSSGMAGLPELHEAIEAMGDGPQDIMILQCISQYPADIERVNLRAIQTLREEFGVLTGFSDHTTGLVAPIAATVMGAALIEKHITLSRAMKGTDHAVSMEEEELKHMVDWVHKTQLALGTGEKAIDPAVAEARDKLSRSLTSNKPIPAGTVLTEQMLVLKSPGIGIQWRDRSQIIGRKARKDIPKDQMLTVDMFE